MGLFNLFKGKTYSISDMPFKSVLLDCLDMVMTAGVGPQWGDLYKAAKSGELNKKQMTDCRDFALWYKALVASQPNLADSFGESSYNATINALGRIADYAGKQLK